MLHDLTDYTSQETEGPHINTTLACIYLSIYRGTNGKISLCAALSQSLALRWMTQADLYMHVFSLYITVL